MANIKGQIKRNRQNEKRNERNKAVRSELKTRVKAARDAVGGGAGDADEKVRLAQKRLDKAGAKGRIHRNAASRRTSRLMKQTTKPVKTTAKTTAKKSTKEKATKTATKKAAKKA